MAEEKTKFISENGLIKLLGEMSNEINNFGNGLRESIVSTLPSIPTSLPPDDEIWYINNDEHEPVIQPNSGPIYGVDGSCEIISNTYENGKGIIKFDKPVKALDANAFQNAEYLTTIYLPGSVNNIFNGAFYNCNSLAHVIMASESAPYIDNSYVFSDQKVVVHVPVGSADSYIDDEYWSYFYIRGYIEGGENILSGVNLSTINNHPLIGSSNYKFVEKDNDDDLIYESLIPGIKETGDLFDLGSIDDVWGSVFADSFIGNYLTIDNNNAKVTIYPNKIIADNLYSGFSVDTNGGDWSLGTPAEGNDEANISGKNGTTSLKSKSIIIAGKSGVTITDDGNLADITLSSYSGVNIVVGDDGGSQGKINITSDAVRVEGVFYCSSDMFRVDTSGECYATSFYETSDENLKDFHDDITVDFNKLKEIRKSYFTWKDGDQNLHIGTSAQDIQKVYPELVSEDNKGNLNVDYAKLSIIALSAIDKLDERLSRIENILNKEE